MSPAGPSPPPVAYFPTLPPRTHPPRLGFHALRICILSHSPPLTVSLPLMAHSLVQTAPVPSGLTTPSPSHAVSRRLGLHPLQFRANVFLCPWAPCADPPTVSTLDAAAAVPFWFPSCTCDCALDCGRALPKSTHAHRHRRGYGPTATLPCRLCGITHPVCHPARPGTPTRLHTLRCAYPPALRTPAPDQVHDPGRRRPVGVV